MANSVKQDKVVYKILHHMVKHNYMYILCTII